MLNKAVLALDLGTKTGWALSSNGSIRSGSQSFKPTRFSSSGMRFVYFRKFLDSLLQYYSIEFIYFEEVRRHLGVDAAHCYGGFLAILTSWCEEKGIKYQGIGVGEIKKFISGKGNASKLEVIKAIENRGFKPKDDNEADALAVLCYGQQFLN